MRRLFVLTITVPVMVAMFAVAAPASGQKLLEALALVGPISRESIFDFIEQEMHRFPLGAAIVLVTALMNEESADAVRELHHAGFRPTVVWVGDDPIPVQIEDSATVFEIGENLAKAEQESQFRQPKWTSPVGPRR